MRTLLLAAIVMLLAIDLYNAEQQRIANVKQQYLNSCIYQVKDLNNPRKWCLKEITSRPDEYPLDVVQPY